MHTFDIFPWRPLNYAVLILTDYEMHFLGYKMQLLKRILRKAHQIFKSRELCFKVSEHSCTLYQWTVQRIHCQSTLFPTWDFSPPSVITRWSPSLRLFANLFKWLTSNTLQSSSSTSSLNGSKFRRRVPENNTNSLGKGEQEWNENKK